MGFRENVRGLLEYNEMQVKELSQKTGISKNTIDKYLSKECVEPSLSNALKIAKALKVSVEYLAESDSLVSSSSNSNSNEENNISLQYKKLNDFNKKTIEDLVYSLYKRQ